MNTVENGEQLIEWLEKYFRTRGIVPYDHEVLALLLNIGFSGPVQVEYIGPYYETKAKE